MPAPITAITTPAHASICRLMLDLAITLRTIESVPTNEAQAALDFEQELTARLKDYHDQAAPVATSLAP